MNERDIRTKKRLADIEAATKNEPLTIIQLAAACHMCECSAGAYIKILLATKRMHIAAWPEQHRGHRSAAYLWGAGRNMPKPKARSRTRLEHERLIRIKADPTEYNRFLSRHRAYRVIRKLRTKPQSWLSALGA